MPRVNPDTLKKLNAFIDSLPDYVKEKCALCNETLTHIVKQAEAQTGAGTRTVCRAIADQHNAGVPEGDKVSEEALTQRVRQKEGVKMSERHNNPPPPAHDLESESELEPLPSFSAHVTEAMQYAVIAISQLTRIRKDDPERNSAFDRVINWIEENK